MIRITRVAGTVGAVVGMVGVVALLARGQAAIPAPAGALKPGAAQVYDHASFEKQLKPFFNAYCISCHSAGGSEKDIPLDIFKDQESLTKGIPNLEKAVQMLRQQKMPPKGTKQPTESERKGAINWLESFTSGCDCSDPSSFTPGRVTLRRLNRAEYNNTIRDLLALDSRPADAFPVDDAGYGFDNIGDVLSVAPILMEKYLTAAEAVMHQAIMAEPILPAPTYAWDANVLEGSVPKTPASWGKAAAPGPKYEADRGNGRIFYYNGEIHAEYDFPVEGTYFMRVRGYSTGGAARARSMVQFSIDGVPFGKPVAVSGEQRLAKDFATIGAKAPAGKHVISVALVGGATKQQYDAAVEAAKNAPPAPPATAPGAAGDTPAQAAPAAGRGGRGGRGGAAAVDVPGAAAERPAAAAGAAPAGAAPGGAAAAVGGAPAAGRAGAPAAGRGPQAGGRGRGGVPPAAANPTGQPTMGIFRVEVEGPVEPTPDRMPESYRRVMVALPSAKVSKAQAAEQVIKNFATKAYRRPLKDDELQRLTSLWKTYDGEGDKFEESISSVLAVVLASPHFLYHMERDPTPAEGTRSLDEFELASRLSYFLWSSMPDAELWGLAEQGKLRANLDAQAARMLKDPKARALAENFAGQWLQLRLMNVVNPDTTLFPAFDPALRAAMTTETQMFFEAIVKEDRSLLDLIDTDFTFLNERLAKHYGIEGVKGDEFRRVTFPSGSQRGGILTQGAVLTITSYANRTSPVQRGKWVLQNLLDAAPPPPPPNVPELKDATQAKGTLRERMVQHRENPACAVCHEQMDAIGFGLENFDGIGAWRDRDGEAAIDPSGVLPGGTAFKGPAELKRVIKGQEEAFCRAVTSKLMTYAIGRGMEKADRCYVDPVVAKVMQNGDKFSVLVREIIHSDAFQKRSAK